MRTLEKLTIRNFKSIREQTLALGRLNVFIGGNGSGKSNLIEVFRFLREVVNENLESYTARKGGADSLLHFGRKRSPELSFRLEFSEGATSNAYQAELQCTDQDGLLITDTAYYHDKKRYPKKPYDLPISYSSRESKLKQKDHICAKQILEDLQGYRVYHFHDTSESAGVKGTCDVEDNRISHGTRCSCRTGDPREFRRSAKLCPLPRSSRVRGVAVLEPR